MPQCPWDNFLPATVAFCEERLCAWIVEPANTWSNIGFVLVGLYLLRDAKRKGYKKLRVLGWITLLEGFGSAWFHGTATFIGEVADVGCMYFISSMFICVALLRLQKLSASKFVPTFLGLAVGSTILLILFKTIGIILFALQITLASLLELRLFVRERHHVSYRWLATMAVTFSIAFFLWVRDIRGIWCDPQNHIFTGHSAWHFLNAFCLYAYYRFLEPLEKKGII